MICPPYFLFTIILSRLILRETSAQTLICVIFIIIVFHRRQILVFLNLSSSFPRERCLYHLVKMLSSDFNFELGSTHPSTDWVLTSVIGQKRCIQRNMAIGIPLLIAVFLEVDLFTLTFMILLCKKL